MRLTVHSSTGSSLRPIGFLLLKISNDPAYNNSKTLLTLHVHSVYGTMMVKVTLVILWTFAMEQIYLTTNVIRAGVSFDEAIRLSLNVGSSCEGSYLLVKSHGEGYPE